MNIVTTAASTSGGTQYAVLCSEVLCKVSWCGYNLYCCIKCIYINYVYMCFVFAIAYVCIVVTQLTNMLKCPSYEFLLSELQCYLV